MCCLLGLSSAQAAVGRLGQALLHRLHMGLGVEYEKDPEPRLPGKGWRASSNETEPGSSGCTNEGWKDETKESYRGQRRERLTVSSQDDGRGTFRISNRA